MRLWLQAIFLIASSKNGISTNQLHRTLGITIKAAWFMSHRIREAMKDGGLEPFGAMGGAVEVDETFIGCDYDKKPRGEKKGRGAAHKWSNRLAFWRWRRNLKPTRAAKHFAAPLIR